MSRQSSPAGLANESATLNERLIVVASEAAISLTPETHAGRIVVLNLASTDGQVITLPKSTGSGDKYHIINNVVQTQIIEIEALGADIFTGSAEMVNTSAVATDDGAFYTSATSDKLQWNATDGLNGGKRGDQFEAWDIAAGTWLVKAVCFTLGNAVTPFSET